MGGKEGGKKEGREEEREGGRKGGKKERRRATPVTRNPAQQPFRELPSQGLSSPW
jgi:hypothetical protein